MDDSNPTGRGGPPSSSSRRWERVAFALFFVSGASALIVEVSWTRQIGLQLGQTAQSAGVVLAGIFAGMALGYAIAARLTHRVRPMWGYGISELIAAGWVLLVPTLLDAMQGPAALGWLEPSIPQLGLVVRAAACFGLLLPATAALGATLPFMAEALSNRGPLHANRVSQAYAWNTAGALAGVLSATAFLLVTVGVRGSSYLAAGLSASCGLLALIMANRFKSGSLIEGEAGHKKVVLARDLVPWVGLAALSGFGTLGLQVLYTRMFALTFQNSTYTFGLVVAVFLGGLSIGSALYGRARRWWGAASIAGLSCGIGGALVSTSVLVFVAMTGLQSFTFGASWLSYLIGASALVAIVLLPPVAALGMILPACWEASREGSAGFGAIVGRLTAINAISAAAGALTCGFFLLPTIGLWAGLGLLSGLFAVVSVLFLWQRNQKMPAIGLSLLMLGLILLSIRMPLRERTLPDRPQLAIAASWEGPYGRTEVVELGEGVRLLRQDLHYGLGSNDGARFGEYRQALLPLLLHEQPDSVLFLGLGTGLTAGPSVLHPGVRRVDVVELIPEVVEAARYFANSNFGVLDHEKVNIRIDDARHDLLARPETYDVIISDLFLPWESKAGYLYTTDFYKIVQARLAKGGLFCQWLPVYQLGRSDFSMIADGFASVFPNTTLWWGELSLKQGMIAMIGSAEPILINETRINAILPLLKPAIEDPEIYLGSASALRRLQIGFWPSPPEGRPLNTDEHPRIEFRAPLRQRNGELLRGDRLLALFDEVLGRQPDDGLSDADSRELYRRRVWQRERLLSGNREE